MRGTHLRASPNFTANLQGKVKQPTQVRETSETSSQEFSTSPDVTVFDVNSREAGSTWASAPVPMETLILGRVVTARAWERCGELRGG